MYKGAINSLSYTNGFNGIILIIYCIFVFSTYSIVTYSDSWISLLFAVIFFSLFSFFACPFILKKASGISITPKDFKSTYLSEGCLKFILYAIPLLVLFIHFSAYYPGGFSVDSVNQYEQAYSDTYNDWHPALQTLFAFKLPLFLSGGRYGSIVLFQVILLAFILGYTFCVILKHTNLLITISSMAFILLNPQLLNISLYPWKDVSFGGGALLLTAFALQIYFTKGQWLKKRHNIIFFVLVTTLTTLFRHNAPLFTIPLIIGTLLCLKPKKALIICFSILLLAIGIKGPLYSALKVEQPDKRQIETLGLPMTIIGGAVANTPELLDPEVTDFAYQIATQECWEEAYTYGSYNTIKFKETTNNMIIEEYGALKVLEMMIHCLSKSPQASLIALIKLTEPVYSIADACINNTHVEIYYNNFGIGENGNLFLQKICNGYNEFFTQTFKFYDYSLGIIHLILIISILSKFKINKFLNYKKLLLVIPVFLYNYSTTLLLTGAEDATRFFYYTYLITPLLLIFIFKKDRKEHIETSMPQEP